MNREKWRFANIPIEFIALKLVEEVGEVSKEITNRIVIEEGEYIRHDSPDTEKIVEELKQVEFLAKTLRRRITQ